MVVAGRRMAHDPAMAIRIQDHQAGGEVVYPSAARPASQSARTVKPQ
jgi:hypothetical protein